MLERKEPFLPPLLLILDGIGFVLLGLGLARYLANIDIIPPVMRYENYDLVFIGLGIALILPMIFHIIIKIREIRRHTRYHP